MKQVTLSAGAVPVRKKDHEWEFLILRAYKYWDFPKGMVEAEEDSWETALREIEEETGLNQFNTPFGTIFMETKPYGKGKVARYYIVNVIDQKNVKLVPNPITGIIEHHEFRWVSYETARSLLVPRTIQILDWVQELLTNKQF
jgi:bis(5'-nucleosidyl)-tetraphosphatase